MNKKKRNKWLISLAGILGLSIVTAPIIYVSNQTKMVAVSTQKDSSNDNVNSNNSSLSQLATTNWQDSNNYDSKFSWNTKATKTLSSKDYGTTELSYSSDTFGYGSNINYESSWSNGNLKNMAQKYVWDKINKYQIDFSNQLPKNINLSSSIVSLSDNSNINCQLASLWTGSGLLNLHIFDFQKSFYTSSWDNIKFTNYKKMAWIPLTVGDEYCSSISCEFGLKAIINYTNNTITFAVTNPSIYSDNNFHQEPNLPAFWATLSTVINLNFNITQIVDNLGIIATNNKSTLMLDNWAPNLNNVLSQLESRISEYIPSYLSNAINVSYVLIGGKGADEGFYNAGIQTTISYKQNGKTTSQTFTLNVGFTNPRQSITNLYNAFSEVFNSNIIFYSNTGNTIDDNNTFIQPNSKTELAPTSNSYVELNNAKYNTKYYNGLFNGSETDIDLINNATILNNFLTSTALNIIEQILKIQTIQLVAPANKKFINYSVSNDKNEINITVNFVNPTIANPQLSSADTTSPWNFTMTYNFQMSNYYLNSGVANRVSLVSTNIAQYNNYQTIEDVPIKVDNPLATGDDAPTLLYYTNVVFSFTGNTEENNIVEINGVTLSVYNNQFTYTLEAPNFINSDNKTENASNTYSTYEIKIYTVTNGTKSLSYSQTILIGQVSPTVKFKWYAWNPNKIPYQKSLITKDLANGKANPNYNPEVNAQTGTIDQILWVNQTSYSTNNYLNILYTNNNQGIHYYLPDPLNEDGNAWDLNNVSMNIDPEDEGFIAEGLVFGKGFYTNFNASDVDVYRMGISINSDGIISQNNNPSNLDGISNGNLQQITPDGSSTQQYWSYGGYWYFYAYNTFTTYNSTAQNNNGSPFLANYIVDVTDAQSQDFQSFTSTLNSTQTNIVPFWDTWHAKNLINYLENEQNMKLDAIKALSYQELIYWWNNYCEFTTQSIANSNSAGTILNFANLKLPVIYVDVVPTSNITSAINDVENDVINQISTYLNTQYNLVLNSDGKTNGDYSITFPSTSTITTFINDLGSNNDSISVQIIANSNSQACEGTNTFTIINKPMTNLANYNLVIKFYYGGNNLNDLETILSNLISEQFSNLKMGVNYSVNWNTSVLNNLLFKNNETNLTTTGNITITSIIPNDLCYGSTTITFENNLNYANLFPMWNLDFSLKLDDLFPNNNYTLSQEEIIIADNIFSLIATNLNSYFTENNSYSNIASLLKYNYSINDLDNFKNKSTEIYYPSNYYLGNDSTSTYWYIANFSQLLDNLANSNYANNTFYVDITTVNRLSELTSGNAIIPIINYNETGWSNINNGNNGNSNDGNPINPGSIIPNNNSTSNNNNASNKPFNYWYIAIIFAGIFILAIIIWILVKKLNSRKIK